jgi:hypothetical protein
MKNSVGITILAIVLATACRSKIDFDAAPPPPSGATTELMISEISTAINTDPDAGGTRPHYVELYNGTGRTIDLADYALGYMAVTDASSLVPWAFGSNFFVLSSNLANDSCHVVASPQADRKVIVRDTSWGTTSSTAAQASTPLQLSGNSAIALLKKSSTGSIVLTGVNYAIIDVFGSPLVSRVSSSGTNSSRNNIIWPVAGETGDTRNRTFFRKATVLSPTTDWQASGGTSADNSQWVISPDRDWDYTNLRKPT